MQTEYSIDLYRPHAGQEVHRSLREGHQGLHAAIPQAGEGRQEAKSEIRETGQGEGLRRLAP